MFHKFIRPKVWKKYFSNPTVGLNAELTLDHTIYQLTRGLPTEQPSSSHHKPWRILVTRCECCRNSFSGFIIFRCCPKYFAIIHWFRSRWSFRRCNLTKQVASISLLSTKSILQPSIICEILHRPCVMCEFSLRLTEHKSQPYSTRPQHLWVPTFCQKDLESSGPQE